MSESIRPNYFILLGIDPEEPWSEVEFAKILTTRKAEWTKLRNHPTKKGEAQKKLELVPKIESLMKNESERKKEATDAINLKSEQQKGVRESFIQSFELFTTKGFITEEEILQLVNQYSSITSDANLREDIKSKGIEIKETIIDSSENEEVLPLSLMKDIKTNLEILNQKNVYDFLELAKSSRTKDLELKAKKIYAEVQKYGDKNTEVTAKGVLAGHATTIFKNDSERAKYDRALVQEAYGSLDEQIRQLGDRPDKTIYAKEFTYLLDIAHSRSLNVDKAANYIRQAARAKNLAVEVGNVEAVKQKLHCPSCDHLNESNREFCSQCNSPLKITCPNCQTACLVEDRVCRCSFPIGNAPNVRYFITESKRQIAEKDFDGAEQTLKYAREEWNTIPPVQLKDELTQTIEQLLQEAQKVQQQQKNLQSQVRQAIQERRFYQARTLLYQIQAEFPQISVESESGAISKAIEQAETILSQVRTSSLEGEEAIALYQQVLSICRDCQPALNSLAQTPPAPPSKLQATLRDKLVSLTWQSSPAKNVSYTIVRKSGSRPISSNDGEHLDTVVTSHYDDTQPVIGLSSYYAVYTNREGVLSTNPVLLNEPVLVISEITNLVKKVSNKQVSLQWTPPENVSEIQVVRHLRYPHNTADAQAVKVLNKSQVIERDLENKTTYYYGIYSLFKDYQGQLITSQGVFVEAIPEEPPIISQVQIEIISASEQRELKLFWTPTNKGEMIILKSQEKLQLNSDSVLPENQLSSLGELLIAQNQQVITKLPELGIVYFTPVVLFQGMAYLGETIPYINLEEITNLKIQKQINALHLYWNWPKNCQQAIIAYSHQMFPTEPNNTEVTKYQITKAQYDLHGYYIVSNPVQRDYYFVVFALSQHNGQSLISPGLSPSSRFRVSLQSSLRLDYEIEKQKKLFSKTKVNLIIKVSGSVELPELVLVNKSGTLPLNKDDGRIILKIPKQHLPTSNTRLSFPLEEDSIGYARLFLADDNLYDSRGGYVRIYHPDSNKMRLN